MYGYGYDYEESTRRKHAPGRPIGRALAIVRSVCCWRVGPVLTPKLRRRTPVQTPTTAGAGQTMTGRGGYRARRDAQGGERPRQRQAAVHLGRSATVHQGGQGVDCCGRRAPGAGRRADGAGRSQRGLGAVASGTQLAAGSLLTRFGAFEAGLASAKDPKYTVIPQKERLAARQNGHAPTVTRCDDTHPSGVAAWVSRGERRLRALRAALPCDSCPLIPRFSAERYSPSDELGGIVRSCGVRQQPAREGHNSPRQVLRMSSRTQASLGNTSKHDFVYAGLAALLGASLAWMAIRFAESTSLAVACAAIALVFAIAAQRIHKTGVDIFAPGTIFAVSFFLLFVLRPAYAISQNGIQGGFLGYAIPATYGHAILLASVGFLSFFTAYLCASQPPGPDRPIVISAFPTQVDTRRAARIIILFSAVSFATFGLFLVQNGGSTFLSTLLSGRSSTTAAAFAGSSGYVYSAPLAMAGIALWCVAWGMPEALDAPPCCRGDSKSVFDPGRLWPR